MGLLIKLSGKKLEDIKIYLETAVENICEGNIIAFPTNSVYGLGCDFQNLNSIERLYNIKYRERKKGFLLLVSDYEEASKIAEFSKTAKKLADQFWPGQLTLILKKREPSIVPLEVTANQNTIGLRVPENEIILKILEILKSKGRLGCIIGTSANYSGEPPSISGVEVAKTFLGLNAVDFIIDSGKTKSRVPTTIVDCTKDNIKILRIGEITEKEIRNFLLNKEEIGDLSE